MQEPEISVLVVEDDEDDALLVQDYLSELRTLARPRIDHVSSVPEALSRLEKTEYGVLLVDYRLGSDDGLSLLRQARLRGVTSPAILLTGRGDEELAVEAIRAGATDYIPKSRLRPETLSAAIRHATDLHRARAERELAERELRDSETRLRAILDSALDAVVGLGQDGLITYWNPRAATMFGWTGAEALGRKLSDLIIPERLREAHARGFKQFLRTGEGPIIGQKVKVTGLRRDGTEFLVELSVKALRIGDSYAFNAFIADITERDQAERRLAAHYAVTRALADSATLDAAAPKIIEAVCESLGWDAGTLWSEDSITRTLGCVALWHRPAIDAGEFERETRALCFAPGGSLPGSVGSGGRPQWIEDMTLETGFKRGRGAARAGLRAAFAFPILLGDRVIAVMEFFSQEARRPDEDRIQTMMSLSGQLGQFIERMRGEEQLIQKARLEALVSDVDAALVQGFDLRQNLQACAEAMVKHLDAALARIWTLSGDGSMLELQASAGMYTHLDGPHGRVPVGKLKIGLIAQERRPHLTNDVLNDPGTGDPEWARREGMVAFAGHPLMVGNRLAGVMALFARTPLNQFVQRSLESVADGIALGIERRRAMEEREKLEAQFLQSQKMEAVGRLAGGIAHDFNNLLTAILGYSNLFLSRMAEDDPQRRGLLEIVQAGDRAAVLTRQLLAFSRKQVLVPEVLDLGAVVVNLNLMLRRLIGEDIELVTEVNSEASRVKADRGQVEQVIVNLVVNARDAMPRGGRLIVEVRDADPAELQTRGRGVPASSRYVMLAISDTGVGMDAEVQSHVFEPFFTTKEQGKGTGLGLATVYGIVRQSGGFIDVDSTPGAGTKFTIYLPGAETPVVAAEQAKGPRALPYGDLPP